MAHKMTTQAHFMRFENFENFPKIYSKNRKISVNVDFCKHSGRDEASHDPTPTPYDVNFKQVFRKVPATFLNSGVRGGENRSMSTGFHKEDKKQYGLVQHELFKPKMIVKK